MTERSGAEQTTAEQATRPWATPGPDARWWHGETAETPVVPAPTRTSSPARHRERSAAPAPPTPAPPTPARALPPAALPAASAPAAPVPAAAVPAVEEHPAVAALAAQLARDDAEVWPAPRLRAGRTPRAPEQKIRRVRRARATRHPALGLGALVVLGLLGVFFAWVSAEPLWLSVGHGRAGTATVASCRVHGIAKRCADFTAEGNAFTASHVALLGTGPVRPGRTVPARMVSAGSQAAYAGSVRLRCGLGLLGVLLCGFGVAWLTGGYRLATRRARLTALALSIAGPVLLTAGMLVVTW